MRGRQPLSTRLAPASSSYRHQRRRTSCPGFSVAELVDGNHSIHVAGTHDSVGENGVMRRIRDRVFDGVELIALLIAGLVLVSLLSTGIAMLVVWVKSL